MGLLSVGKPLDWNESLSFLQHVKEHGIVQFLNIWNRVKTRRRDQLIWGDELEYIVVKFMNGKALLNLKAQEVLSLLEHSAKESTWHPEYGRFMLESTPKDPYGCDLADLLSVEENMIHRRLLASEKLGTDTALLSITNFPRLGCQGCFYPDYPPTPDAGPSQSLFIPTEAINSHPRFPSLTANIRARRGSKVAINVPIFKDVSTNVPFVEDLPPSLSQSFNHGSLPDFAPDALKDHIYMDCMCFGMGCCCLQVTFQACSVEEARRLYDQLAVITPIMLCLTAATPIFRGFLADVDCRWDVISASVDDRNPEERSLLPLKKSKYQIPKSRYDSISNYLSPGPIYSGGCCSIEDLTELDDNDNSYHYFRDEYNDLSTPYDEDVYKRLREGARHYAHLFIRDPLVIFEELIHQDDSNSSNHFENIQSTNWQTMRFKPPPPNTDIGWRVEFRSMEVQLSDKENAAFAIFVVLVTRSVLKFNLNFYIPLSKVDENMKKAQKRDAILQEKFWFRTKVICCPKKQQLFETGVKLWAEKHSVCSPSECQSPILQVLDCPAYEDECQLLTACEIINGKPSVGYPGLVPLVQSYLAMSDLSSEEFNQIAGYVAIISEKASGKLITCAAWIRSFVTKHSDYKHDSVVSEKITFDLCRAIREIKNMDYLK